MTKPRRNHTFHIFWRWSFYKCGGDISNVFKVWLTNKISSKWGRNFSIRWWQFWSIRRFEKVGILRRKNLRVNKVGKHRRHVPTLIQGKGSEFCILKRTFSMSLLIERNVWMFTSFLCCCTSLLPALSSLSSIIYWSSPRRRYAVSNHQVGLRRKHSISPSDQRVEICLRRNREHHILVLSSPGFR